MLCFDHRTKEQDMLLQHCVVAFLTRNREKQTVGSNDYLTVQQLCGCTLQSLDLTIRCGAHRRGKGKMKEKQEECYILDHYKNVGVDTQGKAAMT